MLAGVGGLRVEGAELRDVAWSVTPILGFRAGAVSVRIYGTVTNISQRFTLVELPDGFDGIRRLDDPADPEMSKIVLQLPKVGPYAAHYTVDVLPLPIGFTYADTLDTIFAASTTKINGQVIGFHLKYQEEPG